MGVAKLWLTAHLPCAAHRQPIMSVRVNEPVAVIQSAYLVVIRSPCQYMVMNPPRLLSSQIRTTPYLRATTLE
ncbi:hypothetical protein BGZ57DRAFT_889585 [Hyaloscypha finlandica]|nr:hypothetical protein BGZ57DRAFT_889585 [Hyaloscypha finlandica]